MERKNTLGLLAIMASMAAFVSPSAHAAHRAASGIGRALSGGKGGSPRGSYWKPGPEHLPDPAIESRQVRRRREHSYMRALAREKQHNEGLASPDPVKRKRKHYYNERNYIGRIDHVGHGARHDRCGVDVASFSGVRRFQVLVRATTMAQARRKLRETLGYRPVQVELMA